MIPFATVPAFVWKFLAIAIAAGAVAWWIYDAGQDSKQGELDALRQSYEVAAAQAAGREAERVRMWTQAVTIAGAKFDERAKIADSSFDASLDRLRNAYASVKGVRFAAPAPAGCPEAGGPTAGELLKAGELVAGLVRDADRDRAALASCVGAWPR